MRLSVGELSMVFMIVALRVVPLVALVAHRGSGSNSASAEPKG
jgi:hypothetical protein